MTVRVWRSTDKDAPVMTGQQGKMCDLLLEVLTRGYPRQSGATITRSGSTATVALTGHTFVVGQEVSISGANEAEYNGNVIITAAATNTFDYTVSGTPSTPATGTILVGGEKTIGDIVDLTRSGTTVTAVIEGHGLVVGNRFRVTGANEAQYNGIWKVATVVDVDTVTYELPSGVTPSTPATGASIKARYGSCGAGWSSPFSGTNKRAFKQGVQGSRSQMFLRVNENTSGQHTYGAGFLMCEGMTAIDSFTNSCYATENDSLTGMWKSNTADSVAREWVVVGDHRTILVFTKPALTNTTLDGWQASYFGDIVSSKTDDVYPQACMPQCRGGTSFASTSSAISYLPSVSYSWTASLTTYAYVISANDGAYPIRMLRNHLGQSGALQGLLRTGLSSTYHTGSYQDSGYEFGRLTANSGTYYDGFPDPVHGGLNMGPVLLSHTTTGLSSGNPVNRGTIRGVWEPYHRKSLMVAAGWANNDTFYGTGVLAGKTFEMFILSTVTEAWMVVETSDTWSM